MSTAQTTIASVLGAWNIEPESLTRMTGGAVNEHWRIESRGDMTHVLRALLPTLMVACELWNTVLPLSLALAGDDDRWLRQSVERSIDRRVPRLVAGLGQSVARIVNTL